jgi:branched-chain amino acid transport system substrate-binding protein
MIGYWVGPYGAGGSGIFGGFIDYVNMINARMINAGTAA